MSFLKNMDILSFHESCAFELLACLAKAHLTASGNSLKSQVAWTRKFSSLSCAWSSFGALATGFAN